MWPHAVAPHFLLLTARAALAAADCARAGGGDGGVEGRAEVRLYQPPQPELEANERFEYELKYQKKLNSKARSHAGKIKSCKTWYTAAVRGLVNAASHNGYGSGRYATNAQQISPAALKAYRKWAGEEHAEFDFKGHRHAWKTMTWSKMLQCMGYDVEPSSRCIDGCLGCGPPGRARAPEPPLRNWAHMPIRDGAGDMAAHGVLHVVNRQGCSEMQKGVGAMTHTLNVFNGGFLCSDKDCVIGRANFANDARYEERKLAIAAKKKKARR